MAREFGFIGLGAMGRPMALNLLSKGYRLIVYDIVADKMEPLTSQRAGQGSSPQDVGGRSEVVITILPEPGDVRAAGKSNKYYPS